MTAPVSSLAEDFVPRHLLVHFVGRQRSGLQHRLRLVFQPCGDSIEIGIAPQRTPFGPGEFGKNLGLYLLVTEDAPRYIRHRRIILREFEYADDILTVGIVEYHHVHRLVAEREIGVESSLRIGTFAEKEPVPQRFDTRRRIVARDIVLLDELVAIRIVTVGIPDSQITAAHIDTFVTGIEELHPRLPDTVIVHDVVLVEHEHFVYSHIKHALRRHSEAAKRHNDQQTKFPHKPKAVCWSVSWPGS